MCKDIFVVVLLVFFSYTRRLLLYVYTCCMYTCWHTVGWSTGQVSRRPQGHNYTNHRPDRSNFDNGGHKEHWGHTTCSDLHTKQEPTKFCLAHLTHHRVYPEIETRVIVVFIHVLTHVLIVICIIVFIGTVVRPGVILGIPLPEREE